MKWCADKQAVIITTVAFKTCLEDGTAVQGQFTLRVTHRLDESGLNELLARHGLATVFQAVSENSLVNGKAVQGV